MTSLIFFLLLLILYPIFIFIIKNTRIDKKDIFIKILIIFASLYFFLIYLPEKEDAFEIIAAFPTLLITALAFALLLIFTNQIHNLITERRYLSDFPVIAYYEPPSNIHPAIAGFLIDREIGKREFFASVFNLIISGHIAIDERNINGMYKYYLIKNKGFDGLFTCDRIVSDILFYKDGKNIDALFFDDIDINIQFLSGFILTELRNLKYFEKRFNFSPHFINWCKLNHIDIERIINKSENRQNIERKDDQNNMNDFRNTIKAYCKVNINHKVREFKSNSLFSNTFYTELGAQERAKWLGFKDYLQTAERFRLNEEQLETFSKYLPYAVALGVETQWTNRFENMNIDRIEWFRSQKDESIRRHDDHGLKFKHLIRFMGHIHTIQ